MEAALLGSGLPVTVLRPCAVHGKHSRHPREWWFVKRGLDGRRAIPVCYGADSLFHRSSVEGIASLAEICMTAPDSRILNVGDAAQPSVREIASAIESATGLTLPLVPFAGAYAGPAYVGATPWSTERPFLLDTARARALGWRDEGDLVGRLRKLCDWMIDLARREDWRGHFTRFADYGYDPFDYDAEDRFLAAL
jgi:nucleoside-diphosphate-sugar epimerase